jgi:hypothetical protein
MKTVLPEAGATERPGSLEEALVPPALSIQPSSPPQVDETAALNWLERRDYAAAELGHFWRALIALRQDAAPVVTAYAVDSAEERQQALARVLAVTDAHTIAYGTAFLRDQPAPGRRGGSDDTAGIHGLFIDLDAKRFTDLESCWQYGQRRVSELGRQPTAVVASGYGFHVYFDFNEIWLFASAEDRLAAKSRQRGLAQFFGTDSVIDTARAMRLPGTLNKKNPANPVSCVVVYRDPAAVYSPSDFAEAADVEVQTRRHLRPADSAHADELPPLLQGDEATAIRGRVMQLSRVRGPLCRAVLLPSSFGSRSEADFGVLCGLHALGWSDADAVQAARLFRADAEGAEGKVLRPGYWITSMVKARNACGGEEDSR